MTGFIVGSYLATIDCQNRKWDCNLLISLSTPGML